MVRNILGSAIRSIRRNKKMTQVELSRITGFSQNTISNHENGNRSLDEDDIRKYASALNVSPKLLFEEADKKNRQGITYEIRERFSFVATSRIKELNINLSDLSKKLRVSENTLKKWLDGNYINSSHLSLYELCEAINISPNYIFYKVIGFESFDDYEESRQMDRDFPKIWKHLSLNSRKKVFNYAIKQFKKERTNETKD